jgi:UDP-glucose 4-epimerase
MGRTALVTGGAGFIGSHVARCLMEHDYEVTILDNFVSGKQERIPEGTQVYHADVRSPTAALVVREGRFDVVFHLAAQIDVRKSVLDPLFDAQVNILGTVNLLEAVRASGAPTRFVLSGTGGAIYGDGVAVPTVEPAAKAPASAYGTSKLCAEQYVGYYARAFGIDAVSLRYANVFGPGQDSSGEAGVVAIFCERLLEGRQLTVYGDGRQTRDYVFVGDVARANLLAATAELPPAGVVDARAFNVGTGIETSVLDLVGELRRVAGREVEVVHAPARAGEQRRSLLCSERTRRLLGWAPEHSLRHNLEETFAWFAARHRASPERDRALAAPAEVLLAQPVLAPALSLIGARGSDEVVLRSQP